VGRGRGDQHRGGGGDGDFWAARPRWTGPNVHVKRRGHRRANLSATATLGRGADRTWAWRGSLALGVAVMDTDADLSGAVQANGANVLVSASLDDVEQGRSRRPRSTASGNATGVGASIAINVGGQRHARADAERRVVERGQ